MVTDWPTNLNCFLRLNRFTDNISKLCTMCRIRWIKSMDIFTFSHFIFHISYFPSSRCSLLPSRLSPCTGHSAALATLQQAHQVTLATLLLYSAPGWTRRSAPVSPGQSAPLTTLQQDHRHGRTCKKLNKSIFRSDLIRPPVKRGRCFTQTSIYNITVNRFEKWLFVETTKFVISSQI